MQVRCPKESKNETLFPPLDCGNLLEQSLYTPIPQLFLFNHTHSSHTKAVINKENVNKDHLGENGVSLYCTHHSVVLHRYPFI